MSIANSNQAVADRIWHLTQTGLTEGLSPPEVNRIASVCWDRIFSEEEVIFDQGDPAQSLFILNRGYVRISSVNGSDRERILAIYGNGDMFGEEALAPNERFKTRATAHVESWVSIISQDTLFRLINSRNSVALNCMNILGQRLWEAWEDIRCLTFLETERQVGQLLTRLAERHGKAVFAEKDGMVKLKITLSHEQIGQLLGRNRTYVSMVLSRFRKRGWIDYRHRKLLVNQRRLKAWLEES